jgi:phosphatidylglycerol lysyltransferase
MYGIAGQSWVGMGDPVGPAEEWPELAWRFRDMSHRHGGRTVFYEIGAAHLPLYLDLGLTLLKLGEEGRVPLESFSLEGGARKDLRYTHRRLAKEGCTFEVAPPDRVPPLLPDLKAVSDAWLEEKKVREKGFSLGRFDPGYLLRFPAALVRREGRIIAFANVWPGADAEEVSIDLMRHLPDAPRGVMEFLFIEIMLWGKAQGYRWFNLGMAPLSGIEDRALAPTWNRIGAFVFRHGEHFYNFQGLRSYKQKFDPVWEPRYLASPGGLALPRTLTDTAALISGGLKGLVVK